jgi:hypothetical protein
MGRRVRAQLLATSLVSLLAGCGAVDRNSFVASPWRQPDPPAAQEEAEPDAKALIRAGLGTLFSNPPSTVAVSPPRREAQGRGFTVCVKALVKGAIGPVIPTTLVVAIEKGRLGDRRRAVPADGCEAENYEKV